MIPRLSSLKLCLYVLAVRHRRLASLLVNHRLNSLRVPDNDLGDFRRWRRLEGLDELARYAVVASYLKRLAPGGSVLDVGCAHGILAREVAPHAARYLGIDRDASSISVARQSNLERAEFEVADAHDYVPEGRFDAIVFNEVLYYLREPLQVLQRYADFLTFDGVLILSNGAFRRVLELIQIVRGKWDLVDQTMVVNDAGMMWTVQALRRKRPGTVTDRSVGTANLPGRSRERSAG